MRFALAGLVILYVGMILLVGAGHPKQQDRTLENEFTENVQAQGNLFKIFLLYNHSQTKRAILVQEYDTIASIKRQIQNKFGLSYDQQRLFFRHIELQDTSTIKNYGIQAGSILDLMYQLPGETRPW